MKGLLKIGIALAIVFALVLSQPLFASGSKEGAAKAEWPEKGKKVRMIITHGVGGSVDMGGRGILPYLEKYLGVTIVPENMEGAGGRRAMEFAFAAAPDGYTIVVSAFPSRLIGELLYTESKYKMKEFVHLGSWVGGDFRAVVVAAKSPYKSFMELMEAGKTKKLKAAGGGGLGSTSQLQTVFLRERVKMNADFVPFESTVEVANAVLGGHVDFGVMPLSSSLRYESQGDIRNIAVHSEKRMADLPNVPTMEELGFKNVVIPEGVGGWAPPGTPKAIQDKYAKALEAASKDKDFLAWAAKTKILLNPMGPEEFYKTTVADYDRILGVLDILKTAK
jgi:tripartite-type tricarboxylate transporter receptor subunit TctC